MSRFSGAQGKGAAKRLQEIKRAEAEERNARTPDHRRRRPTGDYSKKEG